eukprot:4658355-Alexandrium_andersonii.AAC.1
MSASLVGSEMCIRDRSPNLPTTAGLEGVRSRHIANSQAAIRNPPLGNPVSYTHLTLPTICSV